MRPILSRIVFCVILIFFWALLLSIHNPFIRDKYAVHYDGLEQDGVIPLNGTMIIEQKFGSCEDELCAVKCFVNNADAKNQTMEATVLDADGNQIGKSRLDGKSVSTSNVIDIDCSGKAEKVSKKKGSYTLRLHNTSKFGAEGMLVYAYFPAESGDLPQATLGGSGSGMTVLMREGYWNDELESVYRFQWIAMIAISFLCTLLLGNEPGRNFLVIGLAIGLLFVFYNPFWNPLDENTHYFRSFAISEGCWHDEVNKDGEYGAHLPENFDDSLKVSMTPLSIRTNPEVFERPYSGKKEWYSAPYMSSVLPFDHMIASAGILIGKSLHLPVKWVVRLARLSDLLFYLVFCYLAIRRMRYYRTVFFTIAVIPLSVFLGAACSQDAVHIAASLCFLAYIFSWIFQGEEEEKIGLLPVVAISLLFVFCASIKYMIYALMLFFVLFIPARNFRRRGYKYILFALLVLTTVLLFRYQMQMLSDYPFVELRNGHVDVTEQKEFILSDLYGAYRILAGYFTGPFLSQYYGIFMFRQFNGIAYVLSMVILCGGVFSRDKYVWKSKAGRIAFHTVCLIMAALMCALIIGALYVGYTPVGKNTVDGIQTRYLIPFMPLLCIPAADLPLTGESRQYERVMAFVMLLANLMLLSNYTLLDQLFRWGLILS